jgi:hypothetical protein
MSGHFSRRKGLRNEYMLRDELRSQGFIANRVPSSGAAEGFKGDVTYEKGPIKGVCELKARADAYAFFYSLPVPFSAAVPNGDNFDLVVMDTSLEKVLSHVCFDKIITKEQAKAAKRLMTIKKLKGVADILVLRIDQHPFLYIRYL